MFKWMLFFGFCFSTAIPLQSATLRILDKKFGESIGITQNDEQHVLVEIRSQAPNPLLVWNSNNNTTQEVKPLDGYTKANGTAINSKNMVAGFASRAQVPHTWAFVWTEQDGTKALPTIEDDWASNALAMNDQQIVGVTLGNGVRPVLWSLVDGQWQIEELPRDDPSYMAEPRSISANGLYIAGTQRGRPVVWSKTKNGWKLEQIFEGYATIFRVDNNGTVVGNINEIKNIGGQPTSVKEAFVWNINQKTKRLGFLSGDYISTARSFNDDMTVVGMSQTIQDVRAYIWNPNSGMKSLKLGSNYHAIYAESIDSRGWIVGTLLQNSNNPNELSRAFIYQP